MTHRERDYHGFNKVAGKRRKMTRYRRILFLQAAYRVTAALKRLGKALYIQTYGRGSRPQHNYPTGGVVSGAVEMPNSMERIRSQSRNLSKCMSEKIAMQQHDFLTALLKNTGIKTKGNEEQP